MTGQSTGRSNREMRTWRRRSRIKDWLIALVLGISAVGFLRWWEAEMRYENANEVIASQRYALDAMSVQAYANYYVIRLEQSRGGRFEARMLELQDRLEQCYAGK